MARYGHEPRHTKQERMIKAMEKLLPDKLRKCLPDRLNSELDSLTIRPADLSEVRLRLDSPASLTISGVNLPLSFRASRAELTDCVSKLCGGSVYAHGATINEGFIDFGGGFRVGVCGRSSDGKLNSVTSLNIRVPHVIRGVSDFVLKRCLEGGKLRSLLISSEPGVGKTTLIRDLASRLGGEFARRVAVIDTRGEIYLPEMFDGTLCDILTGYDRAKGIEIATRTMSPEVIVCDEIGDLSEAKAILSAQNTGVPFIATAHASSLRQLLLRPGIKLLDENHVFSYYINITRERVGNRFSRCYTFDVRSAGEVSDCLQSSGVS